MALPLSALLSQSLISLSLDFERAGAGQKPMPGLEAWSNLLRCVGADGVVQRRLPELTRLSKRAVRARVGNAVRHDWIRVQSGKFGSPAATLGLTDLGRKVRKEWPGLAQGADSAWRSRVGADLADALQVQLQGLVGRQELELPHFPVGYGLADPSITGHGGQDWREVRRGGGDTVSGLAMPALLSQTLVAYTMEYEAAAGSLALDANVLSLLTSDGRPAADLPAQEAEGFSGLERHGCLESFRDGRTVMLRLTERGRSSHDGYRPLLARIDRRWEQEYGIAALRTLLETIVHNLDLDLPHHPIGVFDHRTGMLIRRPNPERKRPE